jgi:hypothetical protein
VRAVPPQVRARDQRELPRPPIAVASACEAPYLGPWSCTTSPFSRSSPFPPVVGWLLEDHRRCDLHVKVVAELPQLLGRSRVLEESTIDLEGIQFTGPVSIDSLPDASNQRSQLCAVIVRNHLTGSPSLRLAGHASEANHYRPDDRHLPGKHPFDRGFPELSHLVAWPMVISGLALGPGCEVAARGVSPTWTEAGPAMVDPVRRVPSWQDWLFAPG